MRATPARVLLFALLVHGVIGSIVLAQRVGPDRGDFDRYWTIATTAGRPYVDYEVERAPGEVLVLKTIAAAAGTRTFFGPIIVIANLAADLAIVAALAWGWGIAAAVYFAVAVLPIFDLLCARIDLWSMAAATVGVAAWQRHKPIVTAIALAVGGSFKVWPLPFAVLLLAPGTLSRPRRRAGPLVAFAAIAAAIGVSWWMFAEWSGFRQVLTFRGAQGWQIESSVGSVLLLVGRGLMRFEAGADRIGSTNNPATVLTLSAAAAMYLWSLWKAMRTGHVGAGWLAGVSALLLLSSLFSPQFMGWLVPGAAIAWAQGDRRPALFTAFAVVLTALEWGSYSALERGAPLAALAVVARNLGVAAITWSAAATLYGARVDGFVPADDLRPVERLEA